MTHALAVSAAARATIPGRHGLVRRAGWGERHAIPGKNALRTPVRARRVCATLSRGVTHGRGGSDQASPDGWWPRAISGFRSAEDYPHASDEREDNYRPRDGIPMSVRSPALAVGQQVERGVQQVRHVHRGRRQSAVRDSQRLAMGAAAQGEGDQVVRIPAWRDGEQSDASTGTRRRQHRRAVRLSPRQRSSSPVASSARTSTAAFTTAHGRCRSSAAWTECASPISILPASERHADEAAFRAPRERGAQRSRGQNASREPGAHDQVVEHQSAPTGDSSRHRPNWNFPRPAADAVHARRHGVREQGVHLPPGVVPRDSRQVAVDARQPAFPRPGTRWD
jgi:hypothetical protein